MSARVSTPRRWGWLVLSTVIAATAIGALFALHERETEARGKEQAALRYVARLDQTIAELTPIGVYISERNPELLSRLIRTATQVAGADQRALREIDPVRSAQIEALLAGLIRNAADDTTDLRGATEATRRARVIAGDIADRERARADQAEERSLYGSAAALLLALLSIGGLMTRERRLSLRAARLHAAEVQHLADHDPLTGLPNRRAFDAHLDRLTGVVEIAVCDLNGFKAINDRLGHHAGDSVLSTTARDLEDAVGDAGTVYRTGGDEFCVVSQPGARVGAAARRAFERGDEPAIGSVGVASWPAEDASPWSVVRLADARMYEVKRAIGGRRATDHPPTR